MEMTFVNESLNFGWQCFCVISPYYMPPVAWLTYSIEATHKTVCHLHLEHGYQLPPPPPRPPFPPPLRAHTAFARAFSCLCAAWPCSSRSRQQKPNQRQLSRRGGRWGGEVGWEGGAVTVCTNQVRGLFRIGSEIIASRSQGRGWPSPRGLIGSWPSQTQQGSVSGQLRLCRLWLCDSANERGHQESSGSDVSGSMSWQSHGAKWAKAKDTAGRHGARARPLYCVTCRLMAVPLF